jgi:hypothetical protein
MRCQCLGRRVSASPDSPQDRDCDAHDGGTSERRQHRMGSGGVLRGSRLPAREAITFRPPRVARPPG